MKDINLFKVSNSLYLKEISSKSDLSSEDCDGYLIRSSESEARKIIVSLKDKKFNGKIALVGEDDAFNRRAIESLKIDYLVSPETLTKFDNLKQRDSGLNHVIARIAKEKGILIIVNFRDIASLKGREKSERIARVMQNVKICRKVGCGIRIGSFASNKKNIVDELGRKAFGTTVGMSSNEVRDCIRF